MSSKCPGFGGKRCDFHGNPNTNGLCSSCFKGYMKSIGADMPDTTVKPSAEGKVGVVKSQDTVLGVTISVRLGDLTVDKVDAIVNAANRSLQHASGLAGAIIKRGGEIIQDESDIYVAEHGKLEDGGVMHTHAGKLPCKWIIHCVGPTWRGGKEGEEQILALAVRRTLDKAVELKCASVTIPAISSGIFGFPKDRCGAIVYDTVVAFIKEKKDDPKQTLKDIRLTNFDDGTVDVFVRVMAQRKKEAEEAAKKAATATAAAPSASSSGGSAAAAGDNKAPATASASGSGGSGAAAVAAPAAAGDQKQPAAAAGAATKARILLLGDDLTAGLYGVYRHPVFGPRDANGVQPASYTNEPVYNGAAANVKYHQFAKRLNELVAKASPFTAVVARAYVGATAEVLAEKLKTTVAAEISAAGAAPVTVAVVLIGSNDVLGVDTRAGATAASAAQALTAQVTAIHAQLKALGVAKTVAVTLPPIDYAYATDLTSDADRAAAAGVHAAFNASLAAGAAAGGWLVLDAAAGLPQSKESAALWDGAWHLSPAGSDRLGELVNAFLSANKLV